mmetsp:Transcript_4963/g.9319  ORF Transcript_4963/g.9319 Transcript_4963/m.9319 type:complete len:249 (-) Transcript_4963:239-985(-)
MMSSSRGSMSWISEGSTSSRGSKGALPLRNAASRYVVRDVPMKQILRFTESAAFFMEWMRWRLEANCVAMMRPWWPCTRRTSAASTSRSEVVRPGESTLVESLIIRVTPSLPATSNADRSKICPSTGSSSIFQSPVCTMVPSLHRNMHPKQSGMECVTRMVSISKGPAWNLAPRSTLRNLAGSHKLYSSMRRLMSSMVKPPEKTGVRGSSAGITQGMAPMWSSCPCVMNTASILSLYCAMNDTSGSTF